MSALTTLGKIAVVATLLTSCDTEVEWQPQWCSLIKMNRCENACAKREYDLIGMKTPLSLLADDDILCWCMSRGSQQEPPELEFVLPEVGK